ncbi:MAG: hypothetical protein ISR99_00250 [Parcubacteria group bacterium]|nr:hypothetical protein [Parcubacteria group bacterium]
MSELYKNIKINRKDGEVEIEGEVPTDVVSGYRTNAIKKLGATANISGFRKGHIPEDILVSNIGEQGVMEEAAQSALADVYPQLVIEYKLRVLGSPKIAITKLASGNPIGFKITTETFPEIDLPGYKEIAKEVSSKKEDVLVTEEDVEKMLLEVRRGKARFEKSVATDFSPEGVKQETTESKEVGEPTEISSNNAAPEAEIKDEDLPELDDEFVSTIGNFKTVDEFKARVREDIKKQKEFQVNDKARSDLADQLVVKTKINVPEILIEHEVDRMMAQMKEDVAKTGSTLDKYLEQISKTEEDLRKDWRESGEKRAKLQLILNAIGEVEHIHPEKEDVDKQVELIMKDVKGAKEENVRAYVDMTLTNQKVFEFLENQTLASDK